ncbi:hypothetical protein [Streptomyces sp. NPDC006645]|uniref:hypothetical protein n=1 Tax=unclassified Streptomyces TaxID=2593676 RepID=UPI0033B49041
MAAIRGRDSEQALSTVMDPAAKVLDKAVKAADKHNDTIVKAGITAAIKRIGDASSGPGSRA